MREWGKSYNAVERQEGNIASIKRISWILKKNI